MRGVLEQADDGGLIVAALCATLLGRVPCGVSEGLLRHRARERAALARWARAQLVRSRGTEAQERNAGRDAQDEVGRPLSAILHGCWTMLMAWMQTGWRKELAADRVKSRFITEEIDRLHAHGGCRPRAVGCRRGRGRSRFLMQEIQRKAYTVRHGTKTRR